jgi:hypothetical protein
VFTKVYKKTSSDPGFFWVMARMDGGISAPLKGDSQNVDQKISLFNGPIRQLHPIDSFAAAFLTIIPSTVRIYRWKDWTAHVEPHLMFRRTLLPIPFAAALFVLSACGNNSVSPAASAPAASAPAASVSAQDALATATPIKHVVVIFGENRSFDHYFGTYPNAQNPEGEPTFTAAASTPTQINNLNQKPLLTSNPS